MKIILLSNYFNHHQKAISRELFRKTDYFEFVETSEMREDRKKLGYGEEYVPTYIRKLNSYNEKEILEKIDDADIVIRGAAPSELTIKRAWKNKIIFRYSERQLKVEECFIRHFPRFIKWHLQNPVRKSVYLLCASAYTSYDFSKYLLFKNKAYKWGYFPETKYYDIRKLQKEKKKRTILWCGRFLEWKHPDDVIEVGRRLKEEGYEFEINFIGTGNLENNLKEQVAEMELEHFVHFLGSMKPAQVRKHMEEAGIFLFTSDKQEGWGAVLNEAMNSGCAVIASHAIGAVPYLIENNKNGLIYKSGDVDMLFNKVKRLLDDENEQVKLGLESYRTITGVWNAEVAVDRLLHLSERILEGEKSPDLYIEGPCSKAQIIKDDWFYE